MYCLFCDVPCIVCVYMCTEQLPPGGCPIAVKYVISYHIKYLPSTGKSFASFIHRFHKSVRSDRPRPTALLQVAILSLNLGYYFSTLLIDLQAGRSRFQFLMVSLNFFIDIILPAALWSWVWLSSNRNEYQECFLGVKAAGAYGWQPYHLLVPIVLKSGSLNLLEPSGPVQACNGIALSFLLVDHLE